MSEQFIMDGCTYYYTHDDEVEGFENFERIVVTDCEDEYVGEVELLHNSECANVRRDNGDVDGVNYFEFSQHSHEFIARWIVGTSY
jgi:hypothetical protein